MINCAIADHYIFGRHPTLTASCITARLDTDTIITNIKRAPLYQHIFTRLQIKAISILCVPWVFSIYISDCDVLTH
ncbi:hypothetical protein D3C86_1800210 [compost metagenome]